MKKVITIKDGSRYSQGTIGFWRITPGTLDFFAAMSEVLLWNTNHGWAASAAAQEMQQKDNDNFSVFG
jgi:hypothetical protein